MFFMLLVGCVDTAHAASKNTNYVYHINLYNIDSGYDSDFEALEVTSGNSVELKCALSLTGKVSDKVTVDLSDENKELIDKVDIQKAYNARR